MRKLPALLTLLCFIAVQACAAPTTSTPVPEGHWWLKPYPKAFDVKQLKKQSFIRVKGKDFVNEKGKTYIFRGVNIADPDKLVKQGQWKESLFEELHKNWGVNTIRLPVHPTSWRSRGKKAYLSLIDEAVVWANKRNIYLILDWHSIGYLPTEQYQHPMYDTTEKETRDFWRIASHRYKAVPTIAVYELFNEPTTMGNTLGNRDWPTWKAMNESLIDMIYAQDKTVIPLVAGFNWAYDLTPIKDNPIAREGVAYAVHPYPQKVKQANPTDKSVFKEWDRDWGYVAKTYPIIATELGWVQADGFGAHIPVIDDGSYGPRIVKYMKKLSLIHI